MWTNCIQYVGQMVKIFPFNLALSISHGQEWQVASFEPAISPVCLPFTGITCICKSSASVKHSAVVEQHSISSRRQRRKLSEGRVKGRWCRRREGCLEWGRVVEMLDGSSEDVEASGDECRASSMIGLNGTGVLAKTSKSAGWDFRSTDACVKPVHEKSTRRPRHGSATSAGSGIAVGVEVTAQQQIETTVPLVEGYGLRPTVDPCADQGRGRVRYVTAIVGDLDVPHVADRMCLQVSLEVGSFGIPVTKSKPD
ncbi:hypothetical protein BU15DRAFT_68659 [Melanogaster broomeanus]|nr:hypothetical protein BU15DRAFT_68659 [Melanogaster broomeanus]